MIRKYNNNIEISAVVNVDKFVELPSFFSISTNKPSQIKIVSSNSIITSPSRVISDNMITFVKVVSGDNLTMIGNPAQSVNSYFFTPFTKISISPTSGLYNFPTFYYDNYDVKEIELISVNVGGNMSGIGYCKSLEKFTKISGGITSLPSLQNFSGCPNIKIISCENSNTTYDTLISNSLKYLKVNSLTSSGYVSNINFVQTNLPNLEVLITDQGVTNVDFIANTNIKVYGQVNAQSTTGYLSLDLATILTGKLHQFFVVRVASLSYSGGGIFPSVITPTEYYTGNVIFQFPPTTVTTIDITSLNKLILDFANQVTTVTIINPLMLTGRTPTNAYTDNSQPTYKTVAAALTYMRNVLGITIRNI